MTRPVRKREAESLTYGEIPDREEFLARVGVRQWSGGRAITIAPVGHDVTHLCAAINMGIDAHLEAIFWKHHTTPEGKRGVELLDVGSLHTLIRRLWELECARTDCTNSQCSRHGCPDCGDDGYMDDFGDQGPGAFAAFLLGAVGYEWV